MLAAAAHIGTSGMLADGNHLRRRANWEHIASRHCESLPNRNTKMCASGCELRVGCCYTYVVVLVQRLQQLHRSLIEALVA
jgi:hypothetical protein